LNQKTAKLIGGQRLQLKKEHAIENLVDGPSECLLNFMKEYDFVAPKDWPGYRRIEG
jgi:hypothetical protein